MFYGDTPQDTRQLFLASWSKFKQKQPLQSLEQQIVDVILAHAEYHALLESPEILNSAYFPEFGETNPFLHMGLHLAIREQVATNRPHGIARIYQRLLDKHLDPLTVEHVLMDPLVECLWLAQRNQIMPDETSYLTACEQLIQN